MSINFFILFISYFLIFISVLGYGLFFTRFLGARYSKINFGFVGLFGLFFLILYSYISNLFLPHNYLHNSILLFIGICLFVYFFYKEFKKTNIKEIALITFILILFFISILISKNHDDFPYYHFPYTYYLTQYNLNIGVGIFGHGFRTPSSIFYLNSLFYLPLVNYYSFNFGQVLILIFSNFVLLENIFNFKYSNFVNLKKHKNSVFFLSLFSLIFINIFFYRISEHGTDRSAQILIFILIIELFKFYSLNLKKTNFSNIAITLAIIISLKSFYILYLALLVPIIFFIKNYSQSFLFYLKLLLINFYTICAVLLTILVFLTFFFNTGCIIYPLEFTCFENYSWSIPKNNVKDMNNWYELWSKAGATPNIRVSNPEIYIKGLNWVDGWIDRYFFNKVSDFLLGITFLSIIILFVFRKNLHLSNFKHQKKYIYFTYLIILILVIEWFFNHPALRYGGYSIIALLFIMPLSLIINDKKKDYSNLNKKVISLILITILIFSFRNIHRLNKEIKQYNYKPFIISFYNLTNDHFRIDNSMKEIIKINNLCFNDERNCEIDMQKIRKTFNINIFIRKK